MKEPRYWFRAKRYGWGWGLPETWEGWCVFVVFLFLISLGFVLFPGDGDKTRLVGYTTLLTLGLVLICYAKGEPPRWRWGK